MTARIERTTMVQTDARTRAAEVRSHLEKFRAPFSLRCGALLIDYIVLAGIVAFSTLVARLFGGGARTSGDTAQGIGLLIAVVVALIDLVVLAGLRGQTLGKWATGLRIERINGERIGIGHALLRHLVGYPLSLLTLGIGFLLSAFNAQGRTLHDVIAGTVVLRDEAPRPRRQQRRIVR